MQDKIKAVIQIIDTFWGGWGWLEDSKKAEVACLICQLFEPKHSGKVGFKTAFASEVDKSNEDVPWYDRAGESVMDEPKHPGQAKFKTAFADELME